MCTDGLGRKEVGPSSSCLYHGGRRYLWATAQRAGLCSAASLCRVLLLHTLSLSSPPPSPASSSHHHRTGAPMLLPVRRPHAAPSRPASPQHVSSSLGLRSRQVDRVLRGSTVARASPAATEAAAALGRRAVVGMALAVSLSAPAYCRAPPPCN